MFNNAGLQEMINTYGERICAISLNNGKMMFLNYPGSTSLKLEDISFDTIGGCDVMVVKRKDISSGREINYTSYVTTEFIEAVIVMDEADAMYRIDPLVLK